jgi:Dyp-type peroxidase family
MPEISFEQIQGNIFGGFNKDHAAFILLEINDPAVARKSLNPDGDKTPNVLKDTGASSSKDVLRFNAQFKALRRQGIPEGSISATWTNLVFTASGFKKLGAPGNASFPKAFLDGMAARAGALGDTGDSAPDHWNDLTTGPKPDWSRIDLMILLASDDESEISELPGPTGSEGRLFSYLKQLSAPGSGLTVLGVVHGETREDQAGHEHFGFKDGVSQPGIRGVTPCDEPIANPDQGNPGQDLLYPGEFVIGYPRQIPVARAGVDGPNPDPGVIAGQNFYDSDPVESRVELPAWADNGSFLVFRRLAQDVHAFRTFVNDTASKLGISPELFGAKLVGRYASGAPLEKPKYLASSAPWPPLTDPATFNPDLADSDSLNNDFEYGDDSDGNTVPRAAHIRKAYPRNQVPKLEAGIADPAHGDESEAESRTQTHRLLRRGIPFGKSLWAPDGGGLDDPRGLLFFAYQSDIARQFEFVQKSWVNDPDFPQKGDGKDPIIAQDPAPSSISGCPFHKIQKDSTCPVDIKRFVKTRGGAYFFSPSIDAVKDLLDPARVSSMKVARAVH